MKKIITDIASIISIIVMLIVLTALAILLTWLMIGFIVLEDYVGAIIGSVTVFIDVVVMIYIVISLIKGEGNNDVEKM